MTQSVVNTPMLQVQRLSLNIAQSRILDNIAFEIDDGQFVGLLGPNGAGKSSLLRCLYRFIVPSQGDVYLLGKSLKNYARQEYAKQVAVVLQDVPNHLSLEAIHVVGMGLTPYKGHFSTLDSHEKRLILGALDKVGLAHKSQQLFSSLSGGEKQRVMIARAIAQKPKLLIMDEPTSHLDVKFQIQIMELAKSMGISILASFHDLNLASAVCDKLLVLKQGRLVKQGKPIDVLTPQLLNDVFGVCVKVSTLENPLNTAIPIPHIRYQYDYNQ